MSEPTKKQFDILCEVEEDGGVEKVNSDENIELYWELVRAGYLQQLVSVGVMWDWEFVLTEKGEEYLSTN